MSTIAIFIKLAIEIVIVPLSPSTNIYIYIYVTVYRKTSHNAAPFEKFFCTYRVVGIQILSSPSFIVVAKVVPTIIDLTVPFRRLETIHF